MKLLMKYISNEITNEIMKYIINEITNLPRKQGQTQFSSD